MELLGVALIVVSLYHLIPAIGTGEIPARWPVAPLRKDNKPKEYQITFVVFSAALAAGAILLTLGLIERLVRYTGGV